MKTYTLTELSCIDTPILVPLCEGAELPQPFADYPVDSDQLDLEAGLEIILYPDDSAPYYAGEMASRWRLSGIEREVRP